MFEIWHGPTQNCSKKMTTTVGFTRLLNSLAIRYNMHITIERTSKRTSGASSQVNQGAPISSQGNVKHATSDPVYIMNIYPMNETRNGSANRGIQAIYLSLIHI